MAGLDGLDRLARLARLTGLAASWMVLCWAALSWRCWSAGNYCGFLQHFCEEKKKKSLFIGVENVKD